MRNVLIVEDDLQVATLLTAALTRARFRIAIATTCAEALRELGTSPPDIALLDLRLPDMHGFEFLREAAQNESAVSVIVTSGLMDETTVTEAYELGALDYIRKPLVISEVLVKLKRLDNDMSVNQIRAGPLLLDTGRRQAFIAGTAVHLTRKAFDVLVALVRARGNVVSHAQLLRIVTGSEIGLRSRCHQPHIQAIARALRARGSDVNIHAVRGVGYAWRVSGESGDSRQLHV